jgi:hypothetical protein
MKKENEESIDEQIKNLYKIFEFEPCKARDYGMFNDENSGSGEDDVPKTEQEDEALLLK